MAQTSDGLAYYQITVRGQLNGRWSDWFDGLTITTTEDGNSTISGRMDQAALHGILSRIRDLAIPLLSVTQSHYSGG